ncbi:MAG: alpha/beta hydrolase [Polyangiaceae bacterium]
MALLIEVQRRFTQGLGRLSPGALRALAGEPWRSPEGFELDPQMQVILRMSNRMGHSDWSRMGLGKARHVLEKTAGILQARPEGAVNVHDEVLRLPGRTIRARVYRDASATGTLPVIVFYHGGGFVLGSLVSHDGECRALALRTGAMVVAVDYRLAPEHPFPAAIDDAVAAYLWVAERAESLGGDARRMAVMGDSAGGNLAAVAACDLRGRPESPVFQVLVYPATDFTRSMPSHEHFKERYFLTRKSIDWFLGSYMPPGVDLRHPRASPLYTESLAGLPPAFVLTAGFDPLRDEGRAYAEAMQVAGVTTQYRCYEGLVHGFFSMSDGIGAARVAFDDIVDALRAGLGTG